MRLLINRLGSAFALVSIVFLAVYLVVAPWGQPERAYAEANGVTFPELDKLTDYTTVERGVTVEHMLTSRAALDAIKAGNPVPAGTQVVLVDYQSGELFRYLVSQKMSDAATSWQYQWFWPDKSIKADEKPAQCYACHRSRQAENFMFTHSGAMSFK